MKDKEGYNMIIEKKKIGKAIWNKCITEYDLKVIFKMTHQEMKEDKTVQLMRKRDNSELISVFKTLAERYGCYNSYLESLIKNGKRLKSIVIAPIEERFLYGYIGIREDLINLSGTRCLWISLRGTSGSGTCGDFKYEYDRIAFPLDCADSGWRIDELFEKALVKDAKQYKEDHLGNLSVDKVRKCFWLECSQ